MLTSSMQLMHLSDYRCKSIMPWAPRNADICSLVFGVIYWFVWTIALPRYRGYRLEEEADTLGDGTTITKLVRKEI